MLPFQAHSASIIGREHIRLWMNNQDAVKLSWANINGCDFLFGVVADGCSEGLHSEVGAQLLATFVSEEIPLILFNQTPIEEVPKALFFRCLGYLRAVAAQTVTGSPSKVVSFIKDFLLCTVLGFVMNQKSCVVFHAGDGLVVIDDVIYRIDQQNRPTYLAYHLVDRSFLVQQSSSLPAGFETMVLPVQDIKSKFIISPHIL